VRLRITHLVDDELGAFGDDGDPGTTNQTCASGTLTFPVTLTPGQSRTCTVTGTATWGPYVNTTDVAGQPVDAGSTPIQDHDGDGDPTGPMDPVTDADPAHHTGVAHPAIDIEKATSGALLGTPVGPADADAPPGPSVTAGTPVTWTYVIQNTGDVPLRVTHLVDDEVGVIGVDGLPATTDLACDRGSATFPLTLPVGGSVSCELDGIAVLGAYANVGSVEGVPLDDDGDPITSQLTGGGTVPVDPAGDFDAAHYVGVGGPVIGLDKVTAGSRYDLATAEVVAVPAGDGVALTGDLDLDWRFTVTNPGDTDLGDVVLVDDAGTPADPSDDVTIAVALGGADPGALTVTGAAAADVVLTGDTGGDGILAQGETWIVTLAGVAHTGSYANDATVTAQPLDVDGDPVTDPDGDPIPPVTADDDSSYDAVAAPAIDLEKATDGEDADTPTGPFVLAGDDVTWTFTVTNTGGVALVDAVVTDPELGGPVCTIPVLRPDEATTCTHVGPRFGSGQQRNDAVVVGTPAAPTVVVDPTDPTTWPTDRTDYEPFVDAGTGDPVPTVTDDDPSHHFGADPGVTVEKATDGVDADVPAAAVTVVPGGPVTWTFVVTNTGNTPLAQIAVTDRVTAPQARPAVAVACPATTLAPGATMTCTVTGTAGDDDHANVGTVTAQPTDLAGDPVGPVLTDDDPSHYRVAVSDLELTKTVDGTLRPGATGTWVLTVTNHGPDPASAPTVVDELPPSLTYVGASDGWTCAVDATTGGSTAVSCTAPAGLAVGESATLRLTARVAAGATNVVNTASVAGANVDPDDDNDDDAVAAVAVPPTGGGGGGGRLPFTGTGPRLALVGLAVLAAGTVLVAGSRRRRRA
jgi:uncharacterized repeat protein (TIGR01451 family)